MIKKNTIYRLNWIKFKLFEFPYTPVKIGHTQFTGAIQYFRNAIFEFHYRKS